MPLGVDLCHLEKVGYYLGVCSEFVTPQLVFLFVSHSWHSCLPCWGSLKCRCCVLHCSKDWSSLLSSGADVCYCRTADVPAIPSSGLGFLLCRALTLFCLAQNTLSMSRGYTGTTRTVEKDLSKEAEVTLWLGPCSCCQVTAS